MIFSSSSVPLSFGEARPTESFGRGLGSACRKPWATAGVRLNRRKDCGTAGTPPAAPLVGAVTTLPNDAFSSLMARAKQLTQSSVYLKLLPPARIAFIHSV